jgi:hypothetical protein
MGGSSRERGTASVGGQAAERKKHSIERWVRLTQDQVALKRGGHGAKALFTGRGLDHEEVKAQEGQASR